ncbi:MAG: hypothetical protein J5953_02765 [Prevotella sp.]|nr:hypothetical protein [Prevotella sp.]MBP3219961.1 hypothetical protein [Prevotella sp.]
MLFKDRFLACERVSPTQTQLVGSACLLVSSALIWCYP